MTIDLIQLLYQEGVTKMGKADDLLRGAIDMHFHGYPELSFDVPNRYTGLESAELMVRAGNASNVDQRFTRGRC